jgi:hypothetical protein
VQVIPVHKSFRPLISGEVTIFTSKILIHSQGHVWNINIRLTLTEWVYTTCWFIILVGLPFVFLVKSCYVLSLSEWAKSSSRSESNCLINWLLTFIFQAPILLSTTKVFVSPCSNVQIQRKDYLQQVKLGFSENTNTLKRTLGFWSVLEMVFLTARVLKPKIYSGAAKYIIGYLSDMEEQE